MNDGASDHVNEENVPTDLVTREKRRMPMTLPITTTVPDNDEAKQQS